MKTNHLFLLLLFLVFQSCMSASTPKAVNVDDLETQTTSTDYKIKVGEQISFKTKVHASVGMGAEYGISDDKILKLEKDEIIYTHPNSDAPGADEGMHQFTFKGLSKGKAKVKIKKIYRGELQKEVEVEVEVI